jgi:hypothetical protein
MNFSNVTFYVTLCHWSVTNVEEMAMKRSAKKSEPLYWSIGSPRRVTDGYMGKITTYLAANKKRNKSFRFILKNIPYFILSDVVI